MCAADPISRYIILLAKKRARQCHSWDDIAQTTHLSLIESYGNHYADKLFKMAPAERTCRIRMHLERARYQVYGRQKHRKRRKMRHEVPWTECCDGEAFDRRNGFVYAAVHAALADIPPEYRELIELRYLESRTLREIQELTRIPEATIRFRLNSVCKQLRVDHRLVQAWDHVVTQPLGRRRRPLGRLRQP